LNVPVTSWEEVLMPEYMPLTDGANVRILGEPEVRRLTNLSRTTRWRLEREGKFPKRLRLSGNRVGWQADEVLAWIAALPRGGAA
jgi:prophage regulatory protein